MAIPAATQWEIQTGGNDTNGGGFVAGAAGTDYSQVAAKRTATGTDDSTTDAVGNGTTTLTSATANFQASIVGNIIALQGGTGGLAQTWRQVVSRTNATTVVLDATVAIGTGITMNIGGALASLGGFGAILVTTGQNKVWIKAGTYTLASASANIATGILSKGIQLTIEGYNTVRGDLGTPPVLQANGVIINFTIMTLSTGGSLVINIKLDGNLRNGSRGMVVDGLAYKCQAVNLTNGAYLASSSLNCVNCSASGCTTNTAFNGVNCYGCIATACTATPFLGNASNLSFNRCISYSNTGASTDGFSFTAVACHAVNCVAYANGRDGFRAASGTLFEYVNCIAESNTGIGFDIINIVALLVNCGAFSGGTDFSLGTNIATQNLGSVVGTGSFFTNAAGGDFSLNNTAGRGAALRDIASPATLPLGLTVQFLDIGAAQHQGSSSSGGEASAVF